VPNTKTYPLEETVPEKQFFFNISEITTGCQTLFTYPTCCIPTNFPFPNRWGMGSIYHRAPQLWVQVGQRFIKYQSTWNKDSLSSTSNTCMDSSTTIV